MTTEDNVSADDGEELISQEGFDGLQKELDGLKTEARLAIAKKLEHAKSLGDLSENAEYAQAKEEHMMNEARISQLEDYLSRVKIIEGRSGKSTVDVGGTFIVSSVASGLERYTIVGTREVDLDSGKISNESPFGKAFIGKAKGESVTVKGPKGEIEYRIVDVA